MKINISIAQQRLELFDDSGHSIKQYEISSAKNGVGQENGSFCTPLGKHIIRAKIGAGQPLIRFLYGDGQPVKFIRRI